MTDSELQALLEQIRAQTAALESLTDVVRSSTQSKAAAGTFTDKSARAIIEKSSNELNRQISSIVNKNLANITGIAKSATTAKKEARSTARAAGKSPSEVAAAGAKAAAPHFEKLAKVSAVLGAGFGGLAVGAKKFSSELAAGTLKAGGVADSFGSVVTSVTSVTKNFGPLGFALSTATNALVGFAIAAAKQGDMQAEAFESLAAAGANTVGGFGDINKMLDQFGLATKDANKAISLIAGNAPALALYAGNVAAGAKAFADLSGTIATSGLRREFKLMGISYEQQRESMVAYMSITSRSGAGQKRTIDQLASSAAAYIKEQDAVTRATGVTAREQQAAQDRAMGQEAFRSRQNRLIMNGQIEQSEKERALFSQIEAFADKDVADAFGSMMDGIVTKAGEGLQILTSGAALTIATDQTMSNAEKAQKLSEAIRQGMQAQGDTLSRTQQFQERLGINFGKLSDKMFGTLKTVPERMEGVGEVQKDLVEKPSKGVLAAVNTAENVIKSMRDIENATQIAVDAVQDFGSKLTWLSKKITGLFPQDESVGGSKMSNVASAAATSAIPGAAAIKWLYDKIPGYAIGGIASGDKSGHLAMLHGTEAVIPLAGGAIPVSITGGAAGQGEVGSGPAFSKANEFSAQMDKVIKALDDSNKYLSDIYDEILGGATVGGAGTAGGASSERVAQEALAEHDHAHPHEPAAAASPELAAQIGKIVNPLEKMTQTSGMMRNDGKTYHGGIDLAGKIGDKIMAPISGVARVLSEKESGGYGNMVEVTDATTGVKHMLAHMDKTMVKTGDVIKAGQQIGTLGNTGKSTGAHLHHEMRDKAGNKIDPSQFYSGPGFGSTAGGAATGYPQMVPKGRRGAAGATAPMSGGVKGNLDMMTRALQEQGITDPKMINATLANVMKETGGKINVEEDLAGYANTSNERIRSIFGARAAKKSDKELDAIKKDPKQFAEMMYGKDSGMGLGNVEEGDAYKFRGRGAVGLTGRANYAAASKDLFGDDRLVKDPELLKDPEMAAKTSAWFMKKNTGAMAQRMGMAGGAKTQEEANLLATSTIAGQAITPGQGFLGKEALGKVTAYSAQLAGGQTPAGAAPPATAVAAAPVTGFAPGAQQPAAQPTTLASMAQNVLGSIFGGGGGTTAGIAGPTAPAAGSDMASITAALQAQTAATQTAITSGMENMTTRLVASLGTTGGVAGGDPAVPALLGEMVAAQREQTTAINRLIQVQTA